MQAVKEKLTEEIIEELEGLPKEKLKEVLGFVSYIKAKEAIDPTQAYFWTRGWQKMEADAEKDKRTLKIIGNGTAKGLIRELKS
ncbi:MAG: hypothetical protein Q8K77_02425 [Thermodesulfovibrionales bacterium]|nr:hypothetical protein [Thermodesulfovibrionales bacterium]